MSASEHERGGSAGEGDVRLSPATAVASDDGSAVYGRLEVFNRGGWGTVCDIDDSRLRSGRDVPQFSRGAAVVACRQLGFQEGVQIQALVRTWRTTEKSVR